MESVQSMETLKAMNSMDIPWDETGNWANYGFDDYSDYFPYGNYGNMGYIEALYNFFIWETWVTIQTMASKKLLYPASLYTLSVACIAVALNARERYRAAWVAASIAIGAAIIEYIAKTDLEYVLKDTIIRLVTVHNLGAVVMILWEKFCLTEEQKRLPWGQRAIATYKIMWNSRFVKTSRPAPVFHLLKAEEERQRAALCTTVEKNEPEELDINTTFAGQPADNSSSKDVLLAKKAWNGARKISHRAWSCVSLLMPRLWNWFSPRNRWLMKTIATIITVWVLDRAMDYISITVVAFDWEDAEFHKASFFRRLHEVTSREIVVRCFFACQTVWSPYAFYTILHSTIAVFFVALRIDEPEEWPPVFGDIRQAWNLRRFWSKFWDRLIYRPVNGLGEMTMTAVGLGQRPFRGKKRWLLNWLVFAISGIFHALTDYMAGIHCSYMWELWWWNINFVGILGETVLLHCIRTHFPQFYDKMSGKAGKAIGFLWLFAWLFWATPKNHFKAMECFPRGP